MRGVHPLRALTPEEERAVQRTAKASSERLDVVQRARALLAVKAGQAYTQRRRRRATRVGIVSASWWSASTSRDWRPCTLRAGAGAKPVHRGPAGPHPPGTAAGARPARRRHRHLVAQDAGAGAAAGGAAPGERQHHPGGAAGGGLSLWQDAHLVSDRHRPAQACRCGAVTVQDPKAGEKSG